MNTKNLLILLFASACGPLVTEPMPDIPETVEYDTVRIEYGDDDLLDAPGDMRQQMLVGDVSGVAGIAQTYIRGTNSIIRGQIRMVEAVARTRPTSYENEVWTWDNSRAKRAGERFSVFQIHRLDNDDFTYVWRVGNTADDLREVFAGEFHPRERIEGRQRGFGLLRFNLSNLNDIDPDASETRGRVAMAFRAIGGVRQVRVATFDLLEAGETTPRSAQYQYAQLLDGAGRFQFAAETDFLGDGAPFEEMSIDSVWAPSTAGRALASLTGGTLLTNEVLLHECWDDVGRISFADATPDLTDVPYEDGDSSACAPRLLEFDLSPPDLLAPQADPEIPPQHPDEIEEIIVGG